MGVILTSVLALWHSLPTYDARYGASRLECLPTEILQHISDHLALDSAGSLTLCSRSLRVLGDRSWYALRIQANEQEKRRFLLLLQRDIPNLLFCYHCWSFIHWIRGRGWHLLTIRGRRIQRKGYMLCGGTDTSNRAHEPMASLISSLALGSDFSMLK